MTVIGPDIGQTLEQRRANHAWKAVTDLATVDDAGSRSYGKEAQVYARMARRLPARVMTAGLGASLAFVVSKQQKHPPLGKLHLDLTDWVWAYRMRQERTSRTLLELIWRLSCSTNLKSTTTKRVRPGARWTKRSVRDCNITLTGWMKNKALGHTSCRGPGGVSARRRADRAMFNQVRTHRAKSRSDSSSCCSKCARQCGCFVIMGAWEQRPARDSAACSSLLALRRPPRRTKRSANNGRDNSETPARLLSLLPSLPPLIAHRNHRP
ncbi:MAG: hypothetical protein HY000_12405 [Planctomycetes bacterium]|nr:hypothetical protein [Planctomycetota bacterium]